MTTILVAEDREDHRYLLEVLLEGCGYTVTFAGDGARALELALASPPDLVISDISMPVMDGYELCRRWQAEPRLRSIPFIFHTAAVAGVEAERAALALGAARFLTKPQRPEALARQVAEVLSETTGQLAAGESADTEAAARAERGDPLWFTATVTDIRERKLLSESLHLKNLVFDRTIAANSIANAAGIVTEVNETHLRLWGYPSRAAVVGKPIAHLFADPAELSPIMTALNGAGVWEGDFTARRHDGSTFLAHVLATSLTDLGGHVIGYQGAIFDVTEQRRVETALRASEERTRRFLQQLPAAVIVTDAEGYVDFANEQACALLGRPLEQVLGRYGFDPDWQIVREDGTPLPREEYPNRRVLETRAPLAGVILGVDRPEAAERFWALVTAFPEADVQGEPRAVVTFVDITARMLAEQKLQKSEQLARTLLNATSDRAHLLDEDGIIIDLNDAMATALGARRERLIGTCVFDHGEAEAAQRRREVVARVISGQKPLRFADRGSPNVLYETSVYPVATPAGEKRQVVVFAQDVTERVTAEQKLIDSERRFADLFEQSPVVHALYDMNGLLVRANAAWEKLWGLPRENLVGRFNILQSVQVSRDGWLPWLERAFAGETVVLPDLEFDAALEPVTDGKGRRKWITTTVYPLKNASGQVENVVVLHEDLTERVRADAALRESQATLKGVVNATSDLIWSVDRETAGLLSFNAAMTEHFRNAHGVELVPGMLPEAVLPTRELAQSWRDWYQRALRDGPFTMEYHTSAGNRVLDLSFNLLHRQDEVFGVAVFGKDITERKRGEAERLKLEEQLRASQRLEAVGRLAGGVAHDFNNILSVILSYTGFAIDELPAGDRVREDLLEVKAAGERAAELTRQLLAFSRRQVLQPVTLNLNEIASGLEKMLRRLLGEDVAYVQSLAPDLGLTLADPGQIEQVILNLVINARDAMPGGGTLRIETSNLDIDAEFASRMAGNPRPGGYVQLVVADTGCGMDEHTQARIFEPFFTTKEKGKGTGLGLPTVYGIIKQSSGYIWASSEVGRGATFRVLLPRVPAATTLSGQPVAKPEPARGSATILVAEDEAPLRKVAVRALEAAGHAVLAAADADEALQICREHAGSIDVLLTDVVMPGLSGRVLAQRLLKARPALRVVYMSGYTDDAIIRHGTLEAGIPLLAKPFTRAELLQKVQEVLAGGRASTPVPDQDAANAEPESGAQFDQAALLRVDPDLRAELRRAAVAARYGDACRIIERVRATEPPLATELRRLLDEFEYSAIRDVLDAAPKGTDRDG